MFIQVIQGKSTRPDELRTLAQAWRDEGGGDAVGYLGGTYGVTDDGDFLGVVRFASRDDGDGELGPAGDRAPSPRRWRP